MAYTGKPVLPSFPRRRESRNVPKSRGLQIPVDAGTAVSISIKDSPASNYPHRPIDTAAAMQYGIAAGLAAWLTLTELRRYCYA